MRDPKKISSELLIIFFIFANVKKQSGMLDRTFFLPLIIRLLTTGGGLLIVIFLLPAKPLCAFGREFFEIKD